MYEAAPPKKLFGCGDARGSFAKLFSTVEAQMSKVGRFDALLCVGTFLPDEGCGSSDVAVHQMMNHEKVL